MPNRHNLQFAIVEIQPKPLRQHTPDLRHNRQQPVAVGTDDIKVIHIATIMAAFQFALHKLVEHIEIHIAEKLRGKVANRQSATLGRMEQTLVVRKVVPIGRVALDTTVFQRIEHNNLGCKVLDKINVNHFAPPFAPVLRHAVPRHPVNAFVANTKQTAAVNVHKITANVHLHHIAWNGKALAFLADMAFEPPNAVMSAAPLYATVGVVNESALKHFVHIVVVQVVNNAVAEIGGKNFALLGVGDYEAGRWARHVFARKKFIAEFVEIALKVCFETFLVGLVTLMTASIVVGIIKVGKKLFPCKTIGRLWQVLGGHANRAHS